MSNATDHVCLRSTFCLSPFSRKLSNAIYMYMSQYMQCQWLALRPINIAEMELNRTELPENYELPIQFSSVPAMRIGLQVNRQFYKQDLYGQPTLMTMLCIAPPARSGRQGLLWWMNTNFRQWGIWARRCVDQSKNANFTHPRCIWCFHSGWYHLNMNNIWCQKTRVPGLSCGILCAIPQSAILTQYQRVTDRLIK